MHYTMHDLPLEERPREKMLRKGSEALTLAELIAIVIGTGTRKKSALDLAHELLGTFGSLYNLADATISELQKINGMGLAKAVQLKAAITLGMKAAQQRYIPQYRISSPQDIYYYIKDEFENLTKEHFAVILLDAKCRVISHHVICKGTQTTVLVDSKEIFRLALRHHAVSFVVIHNHPSGDPTPSQLDMKYTEHLSAAAAMMEIPMLDHVVIGHRSYASLFDKRKVFHV